MARGPRTSGAPAVSLGYLAAGAIALAVWLGVGWLLWPLMPVLAWIHARAAKRGAYVLRAHHRWLAHHHLLFAAGLLAVVAVPLAVLPAVLHDLGTWANTWWYAPHPAATLAAAWPPEDLPRLIAATLVALAGWFVVTLWMSLRLLRRGLKWAEAPTP